VTPVPLRPGIGLRPGGERPDLEDTVVALYDALYACVRACSRLGLDVVVDVGHHDDYSRPLGILSSVARDLQGWPAYLVGVRCPVEVIMARRDAGAAGGGGGGAGGGGEYVTSGPGGAIPDVVHRWERAVHDPGVYDLEVDTSTGTPEECAEAVGRRLEEGPPRAFATLAALAGHP
jgi:chloramphenicol 3-O phosphotransferase